MEITEYNAQDGALVLTKGSVSFLQETAKWAKFISIVGFIGIGFLVLIALFAGTFLSAMTSEMEGMPFGSGIFISVIYIIMAALYFFPILYLYRFSVKTQEALRLSNTQVLQEALENLKKHYKFYGILLIVALGFYALAFLFGIIGGIIGAAAF